MPTVVDVAIIGGGPAGAAAGISALQRGLEVALLEAAPAPIRRPGETLHPGVGAIFDRLGVLEDISALATLRPVGVEVVGGGRRRLDRYGADERGPWLGFQIARHLLDGALLDRFEALGGKLVRPVRELEIMIETDGRVVGLRFDGGETRANCVIDASGSRGFLRRSLGIGFRRLSPPLVACYGYCRGLFQPAPRMDGDASGWTWIAQVETDRIAWVNLGFTDGLRRSVPDAIAAFPALEGGGASDVSWRLAERIAGPGWFAAGDAACLVDPAGSHGVLRALMSGMMAAHSAAAHIVGSAASEQVERSHGAWIRSWFQQDVVRLLKLYAELGVEWAGATLASYDHGGIEAHG